MEEGRICLALVAYWSFWSKTNQNQPFPLKVSWIAASDRQQSYLYIYYFQKDITICVLQHQGPVVPLVGWRLIFLWLAPPSPQGEDWKLIWLLIVVLHCHIYLHINFWSLWLFWLRTGHSMICSCVSSTLHPSWHSSCKQCMDDTFAFIFFNVVDLNENDNATWSLFI